MDYLKVTFLVYFMTYFVMFCIKCDIIDLWVILGEKWGVLVGNKWKEGLVLKMEVKDERFKKRLEV